MDKLESFGRVKPVITNFDSKISDNKKTDTSVKTRSRFDEIRRKSDRQNIGSYDSAMFKDGGNANDNDVKATTLKSPKSYKEFVDQPVKGMDMFDSSPVKETNQDLTNDFDNSNVVKSQPKRNSKPIRTLEGIEIINKEVSLEYGSNSRPNYLYIANMENLNVKDYAVVGLVNNENCFMNIVGFTDKFELIFKIDCEATLITEGTSRFFKERDQLYMGVEVTLFNKNKPVSLNINGRELRIYFRELNKTYNNVKTENIYEIRLLRMSLI